MVPPPLFCEPYRVSPTELPACEPVANCTHADARSWPNLVTVLVTISNPPQSHSLTRYMAHPLEMTWVDC